MAHSIDNYRPEIDGLRALAVVSVILYHTGLNILGGGFVGVDVFFVISGYLITGILLKELAAGRFSMLHFYERRARRIIPALFLVMFCCLPFGWAWLFPADLKSFSQSLIAVPTFTSNLFFWRTSGYFETASELKPLLHTWSLAVEEQYYIVFPVLLLAVHRFRAGTLRTLIVAAAGLSLLLAQWASIHQSTGNFYLLPTRAWELLAGAWIAHDASALKPRPDNLLRRQVLSLIGVLLLLYAACTYDASLPYPSYLTAAPVLGTALIVACGYSDTLVGTWLRNKFLVTIGLLSYSAYLWHQPLFAFARHRSIVEPGAAVMLLLSCVSCALAYLSWRFVEQPCRRAEVLSRRGLLLIMVGGGGLLVAMGYLGNRFGGLPERFPSAILDQLAITPAHVKLRDDGGCNATKDQSRAPRCRKGRTSGAPRVALVGDSHAASLAFELSRAFDNHDLGYVQYTKNNCPMAFHFIQSPEQHCRQFQAEFLRDLAAGQIDTVIVLSRWPYYPNHLDYDNLQGGIERREHETFSSEPVALTESPARRRAAILADYEASLRLVLSQAKTVVIVYPIPEQGWDIPTQVVKRQLFGAGDLTNLALDATVYEARNRDVVQMLDGLGGSPGIRRVRPGALLCNTFVTGRCAAVLDGKPLYYDDDHLSNTGAELVAADIVRQLQAH